MKYFLSCIILVIIIVGCSSTDNLSTGSNGSEPQLAVGDTIRIANDTLEYEITIIEPGFNLWINSVARPRGYYNQSLMERKNMRWVTIYNQRVSDPRTFGNLYPLRIDYNSSTNYGYEVNYMLYNYFLFFQERYRQKL